MLTERRIACQEQTILRHAHAGIMKDTRTTAEKIAHIQEEIDQIDFEISEITEKIDTAKKIQEIRHGVGLNGGIYRNLERLPDYTSKWKNSFWGKNRILLEEEGGYTLEENSLEYARCVQRDNPYAPNRVFYFKTIVKVNALLLKGTHAYTLLSDPFNTIIAETEETLTETELETFIGKYCKATIGVLFSTDTILLRSLTIMEEKDVRT